jgi:hypothetical protein
MQNDGKKLISKLKTHVLDTMKGIPECGPKGTGCSNTEIQDLAGLDLNLPAQDGWVTWSVLVSLAEENKVESLRQGNRRKWRLL